MRYNLNHQSLLLLTLAGLAGLAGLAADLLTSVSDALPLIRFRFANAADFGRLFAHLLLVDARDVQAVGAFDREGDAGRGRDPHRVGEAQGHHDVGAFFGDTIA